MAPRDPQRLLVVLFLGMPLCASVPVPTWGDCPFAVQSVASRNLTMRCSRVEVPRHWDWPAGATLSVFVSVILTRAPSPKGTLWFLNGGSGVGGACVPSFAAVVAADHGYNVALPDFRGVGLSEPRIECPGAAEGMSVECAEFMARTYGAAGMGNFTLTQAAHDLHHMIARLGSAAELGAGRTVLQGNSFGTFWAQRYLTIYPAQVQAAFLESFGFPPAHNVFEATSNTLDWAMRRVMGYCARDVTCGSRLGGGRDPFALLQAVTRDPTLHCLTHMPAAFNGRAFGPQDWQRLFRKAAVLLLGMGRREPIALVPAVVYRMARCSPEDRRALLHLFNVIEPAAPAPPPPRDACTISEAITSNMFFSEAAPVADPSRIIESWASLIAPSELPSRLDVYAAWPKYTPDQYFGKIPSTNVSLLFVQGDLDMSTPFDAAVLAAQAYGASQRPEFDPAAPRRIVFLPQVPHVALFYSPVSSSSVPCALQLLAQFLHSPTADLDLSCVGDIVPLDFVAGAGAAAELLGVDDPWDFTRPFSPYEVTSPPSAPPAPPVAPPRDTAVVAAALVLAAVCAAATVVLAVLYRRARAALRARVSGEAQISLLYR